MRGPLRAALVCVLAAAGCAGNDPLEDGELGRVGRVHLRLEPADRTAFEVDSDDAVGEITSLGIGGYLLLPFAYPFAAPGDARQTSALREALGPGFDVGPAARDRLALALAVAGWKVLPGEMGADSILTLEVRKALLDDRFGGPPGVRVPIRVRLERRDTGALLWRFEDPGYTRGIADSTELAGIWVRRDVPFEAWTADGGRLFREDAATYVRRFVDIGIIPDLRPRRLKGPTAGR